MRLSGEPTPRTPHFETPLIPRCGNKKPEPWSLLPIKAKIGNGQERQEKWCFSVGFGLTGHVQMYRIWQNQNHHQKCPTSRIGRKFMCPTRHSRTTNFRGQHTGCFDPGVCQTPYQMRLSMKNFMLPA